MGLVFVFAGVTNLVFRKRFLRWSKEWWNQRLKVNPTDGFFNSQILLASAFFIGIGGLAVVVAVF